MHGRRRLSAGRREGYSDARVRAGSGERDAAAVLAGAARGGRARRGADGVRAVFVVPPLPEIHQRLQLQRRGLLDVDLAGATWRRGGSVSAALLSRADQEARKLARVVGFDVQADLALAARVRRSRRCRRHARRCPTHHPCPTRRRRRHRRCRRAHRRRRLPRHHRRVTTAARRAGNTTGPGPAHGARASGATPAPVPTAPRRRTRRAAWRSSCRARRARIRAARFGRRAGEHQRTQGDANPA